MATSIDQTSRSIWNKKSAILRKTGFTDVFYILNKDILMLDLVSGVFPRFGPLHNSSGYSQ